MDFLEFLFYLLLPWTVGLIILLKREQSDESDAWPGAHYAKYARYLWIALLAALFAPAWIWTDSEGNSTAAASYLADASLKRVGETLLHLFRYILPFTAYPLIVFWLKLMVNYRADEEVF